MIKRAILHRLPTPQTKGFLDAPYTPSRYLQTDVAPFTRERPAECLGKASQIVDRFAPVHALAALSERS